MAQGGEHLAVKVEQVDAALIDTVCSRVRERVEPEQAPQLEEFVRQYYRWVPPEDLVGRDALSTIAQLEPELVLVGHGEPVVHDGAAALREALYRPPWIVE